MIVLLFGYLIFAIVVLVVVNLLFANKGNSVLKTPSGSESQPTLDASVLVEPSATSSISGPISSPLTPPRASTPILAARPSKSETIKIVTVLMLGAFVAILNQTIDNVAIPHQMLDFNVSASTVQWLVTAYMLVNGVLIPISAFLMETFGTRKLLIVAMLFFSIGSFVCGLSPTFAVLVTGRVIQAVGSGILLPLMTNVFLSIFPPESRGKAMGIMGIAMIFAPALGPTVGGWVVETYTWRLLFYAMVPIGIFDLILASIWMKNVLDRSFPKFDLSGAVLSTIGFGGLLYGVSEAGNKGWGNDIVLSALGIGVVALIIFVRRELRITVPLLELRVFKYDMFTLTMVISAIVNMSMYAGMLLLPIYLQNIRNFTALQSGFLLLPGALIMGFMGPIAGAVFDRIGARLLSIIGLVVMTLTTWEFSKLTLGTMYSHIITLYIFRSFGMSLLLMPLMAAGLNQLPRVLNSHGTAMRNTVRQVAGSLGTAVLVTVMSTRTTIHLANYSNVVSAANPVITTQLSSLAQNLGFPPQAGPAVAVQTVYGIVAKQAAVDGINDAFIVATGITVVALLLAFFIRRVFPPEAESTD